MTQADLPRVLVVDDDPGTVAIVSKAVGAAGHQVLTARNGADALEILCREGPPLLITDWVMPRMDGVELCRRIRAHEDIRFAYIIILTGHSDEHRLIEAFEAGVDDFLTKPVNRQELLARLRAGVRVTRLQQDLDQRNRELQGFNKTLNRMAMTDELTGLTNRREALVRLDEAWASAVRHDEPLACITLDIDHFKTFNDRFGHAVGDLVLQETAGALNETTRRDERVCRIGGEEFLVVCPRSTGSMAATAAERMREAVQAHVVRSGTEELRVTISLGVAERTKDMSQPSDLLKAADQALYAAKNAGRNRVHLAVAGTSVPAGVTPARAPRSEPAADRVAERTEDVGAKVLVVDDDADVRALCRRLLAGEGYEVEEAADGFEALSRLSRSIPDVIVMDAMMPNLDGAACTRRLKTDPATSHIPVIMASARTGGEDVIAGLEAGVDEYITKPFRPREFVLRVRSMARLRHGRKELLHSHEVRGEQTRVMLLLSDYCHRVASAEDLDTVLDGTITAMSELTGCRRMCIMLPDARERFLSVVRSVGIDENVAARVSIPIGSAIAGRVFESSVPFVINRPAEGAPQGRGHEFDLFSSAPLLCQALSTSERVVGVLTATGRVVGVPFEPWELEYADLIANIAAAAIQACLTRRARDEARDSIVVALANLAECRDADTGKHVERVTRFCMMLAQELRSTERYRAVVTDGFLRDLERTAPLHDVGKVAVPDRVLNKPGPLTDEETAIMRTHTTIGASAIQSVIERVPGVHFLEMAREIAWSHHEWYNGEGYPRGLSGKDIPLAARIAAVADVYDALTTRRTYKDAMPHDRAIEVLVRGSGTQFDPDVVNGLRRCQSAFEQLVREFTEEVSQPCAAAVWDGA